MRRYGAIKDLKREMTNVNGYKYTFGIPQTRLSDPDCSEGMDLG